MHRVRTLATTALFALIALTTATRSHAAEATVLWTAPGGDGSVGRAAAYDLRFSRSPIAGDADFVGATAVTGLPAPAAPGTRESFTITGLEAGVTYHFAIKTVDAAGNWSPLSNVLSGQVYEAYGLPGLELAFSAPWPNPARERTSFRCTLPEAAPVRVEVFDVTGRRVRLLAQGDFAAGLADLGFDLRDDHGMRLPRGVYLVRARLGAGVFTRRLVVVG